MSEASDKGLSRRNFFKRFLPGSEETKAALRPDPSMTAVVQARYCLASEDIACRACLDACPEAQAIVLEDDFYPFVQSEHCTGCKQCIPVCPAEEQAIIMIPRES